MKIETMKWVEDAAKQTIAFQINCADAIERQASAFLNLLLAGAGGSLAYAISLSERQAPLWQQFGMATTSSWLFLIAACLLIRVMWSKPIYGPANDPENLKAAYEMDLAVALVFELENNQFSILQNRARNDETGRWLNICRMMAAATPILWVIVFLAAY